MVNPDDGTWYTVGDYGAEFAPVPKGAIVFNHKQTKALLKYGKVAGRGKALVGGTAMMTGGGGLWKPPSSSGSGYGYSGSGSSYTANETPVVDTQKITDAVAEGAKEGVEEGVKTYGAGPDGKDGEDDPFDQSDGHFARTPEDLINKGLEWDIQHIKEQKMLQENNAINEKLISYLLSQNFGFTDEELQSIINAAHERYGEERPETVLRSGKWHNLYGLYDTTYGIDVNNPSATSYALRLRTANEELSSYGYGNIEDQIGLKLSDSAYTKEAIRGVIEKFFDVISTGYTANFKNVDELKKAIAFALYNPDYLMNAFNHSKEERVSSNEYTDNTVFWKDTLWKNLDNLFSGDWYEQMTTEEYRTDNVSEVISSGVEDLIEIFFDRLERRIDKVDRIISSTFRNIDTRTSASYDKIELLTQELADKQRAADAYKSLTDKINLSESIKKALRDGDIKIEDLQGTMSISGDGSYPSVLEIYQAPGPFTKPEVLSIKAPEKDADAESVFKDNVSKYQDYYEKYLDSLDDIDEIKEAIAEALKERFDNIQTDYDNQISLIEHESSVYTTELEQLQNKGYNAETKHYDTLIEIEDRRYKLLEAKRAALQAEYDDAMSSGAIDYASEAWYELIGAINETDDAMQEVTSSIIDYTNKARELVWDVFDSRQERIELLIDQNEFLMDLIDEDNVFDKDGRITQKGVAYISVGLDSLRKNMKIARNYGDELERINEELRKDPKNEILTERARKLREEQQQYILSAKKSAKAINDIELESLKGLIDNYEDALDKQKDSRSYQRSIKEKTDDIADIRKQIAAYANDTSEDAVRRVQELRKKLKDEEEGLEDAQYDHYIDMQKEMLDDLYEEYEETLNRRFDDVNAMIDEVASGLEGKAEDIAETLHTIAQNVGYIIQKDTDASEISLGDVDLDGLITPDDARLAMRAGVGLEKLSEQQKANGDLNGDGAIDAGDARAILRVATKIDTIEQYLQALGIVGYSGGGLVSKTGLAMLHGTASDPEIVLDANDSRNLLGLRDIMREMTRMDITALDVSAAAKNSGTSVSPSIGEIQINIPIDKVEDYNDFIDKMKSDDRFGRLIRAASVDLLTGSNSMKKYQI